jgi:imidazoleglycerol phosphate synthase glutamine amidotransferase subunit HisH
MFRPFVLSYLRRRQVRKPAKPIPLAASIIVPGSGTAEKFDAELIPQTVSNRIERVTSDVRILMKPPNNHGQLNC